MSERYDFSPVGKAIDRRIAEGILPGAVACVNLRGERVYEYAGGYRDVESKSPIRKDSIFRLASMTKPITVTAVLILCDRGKLSVKDKVSKFFPSFAAKKVGKLVLGGEVSAAGDAEREITVEDILTHSSGLGSGEVGDAQFERLDRARYKSLQRLAEAYGEWYLDFSPGSSQAYSPAVALDVAAAIVELASGTEYEEFLKKNIFSPLGMTDTGYALTDEQYDRVVTMYRLSDAADGITRSDFGRAGHNGFPAASPSGSTCMFGTMEDYSRFAEMLCFGGETNGVRILSQDAVRKMRTPHFENGFAGMNGFFNWGYGVRVRSEYKYGEQELTPKSYGWSGAYNTHFWVDPELKLTAVLMSNMDNGGGAGSATAFEFECNTMRAINKR